MQIAESALTSVRGASISDNFVHETIIDSLDAMFRLVMLRQTFSPMMVKSLPTDILQNLLVS